MPWRLIGTSTDGELDLSLTPPDVITIGRGSECSVHLTQRQVSRLHAEVHWAAGTGREAGHWRVRDCASTSGTNLNGVRLTPHREVRLYHGDSLEIRPWKFLVEGPASDQTVGAVSRTLVAEPESEDEFVALAALQPAAQWDRGLLERLLEVNKDIARAEDLTTVGRIAVEALASAIGYTNVAFLRPIAGAVFPEVVAQTGEILGSRGEVQVSRSLLKRARNGAYVHRGGPAPGGTLAASLASLNIRQAIVLPVESGPMFFGWLYLDNRTGGASESRQDEAVGFAAAVAGFAGLALSSFARVEIQQRNLLDQQEAFGWTMIMLIRAIDAVDPYTAGHSERVSEFAKLLAQAANFPDEHVEQTRVCGLLHDIGKLHVNPEILRKATHLDAAEFAQIQQHPQKGYDMLKDIPRHRELLPGVLEHHERWDGSGYPRKLKGEQISQIGRVLCIADCFDAMTSARSYRPARTIADVRGEIERCLGTHFDPELGRTFLSIRDDALQAKMTQSSARTNG